LPCPTTYAILHTLPCPITYAILHTLPCPITYAILHALFCLPHRFSSCDFNCLVLSYIRYWLLVLFCSFTGLWLHMQYRGLRGSQQMFYMQWVQPLNRSGNLPPVNGRT
jgi:hypothetical protein